MVAASCLLNEKVQRLRPFWKIVVVLQTDVMMVGLALHGVLCRFWLCLLILQQHGVACAWQPSAPRGTTRSLSEAFFKFSFITIST